MVSRFALVFVAAAYCASLADAQTTRGYEYDALGRLVKVTPSDGIAVCYAFDAADNRSTVVAGTGCASGGGGGSNSPPTANDDFIFAESDYGIMIAGPYELFVNDTDPDLPSDSFTITAVGGTHAAYATIQSGGQSIYFAAGPGTYSMTYTLMDSGGLTSTASIDIQIIPPIIITCPPECW